MKKMNSTLLFSVKEQSLETRKLRKLLAKEEEEEVQEDVQRDSKVVKEYMKKLLKCKSRSCFYRLFMSGQEKPLEEL